ncbi:MAG: magnesium transporter [Armatimonadetes bacterium]|nr:magnesium transporter [Armatimonadota bacterium]
MTGSDIEHLVTKLHSALGQGGASLDTQAVLEALDRLHPSDIADLLDELSLPEAQAVFDLLPDEHAAEVLDEVVPDTNRYLVEHSPHERIVKLLDILPMDDAAEVVAEVGEQEAAPFLADLAMQDAREVTELLAFPERTAGRLMTDKFAAVGARMTAAAVLDYLRESATRLETINVVYMVNDAGQLEGVFSIRDLLMTSPDSLVASFANSEPITVTAEADQQDVARLISQYDLVALPVIDRANRILGIVTVDDVIDVLVEEFEEDVAKLVGTDAEEMERKSPLQVATLRLPWIMATMFIELLAGLVIHHFDQTLTKFILLASFMPIISAISGNTGLQSAAIIIRGLSTGHVQLSRWRHSLMRQVTTTMILGAVCALVLGIIGAIWDRHWAFGMTVFLGMFMAVNIAGIVGTVVPLISKRAGYDPALTAGPFETAFQDVIGISIFLSLASVLLHWLR